MVSTWSRPSFSAAPPSVPLKGAFARKRVLHGDAQAPQAVRAAAAGSAKGIAKRIGKRDDLAGEDAQEDLFRLPREARNIGAVEPRSPRGGKARGDGGGARGEGRLGAGGAAPETQQGLAAEPLLFEQAAERAHPRAGIGRIAIGGIGQKRVRLCCATSDQFRFAALQQRSRVDQPEAGVRDAAMPESPAGPLPRRRRNRIVSA